MATQPQQQFFGKLSLADIPGIDPQFVTTSSSGVATVLWKKPFAAPPIVQATAVGNKSQSLQATTAEVYDVTATGCTVRTWMTKGTLVLTAGPVYLVSAGVYIVAFGEIAS